MHTGARALDFDDWLVCCHVNGMQTLCLMKLLLRGWIVLGVSTHETDVVHVGLTGTGFMVQSPLTVEGRHE